MAVSRSFQFLLPIVTAIFTRSAKNNNNFLVAGFLPSCLSLSLASSSASRRDVLLGGTGGGASLWWSTQTTMPMSSMSSSNNEEEPTTIRWGIVGLGDVTQVKSGPPFWKCEGSELVAVMRRTPGKAAEFAARVPTSNRKSNSNSNSRCVGYDDLDRFLEHPGLEAVYVCTRPGTHASIARKVADAGLACYIEKPVGRCAAETRELAELFDRKALPFYTAYISRAYERTRTVKQLIASGALGDKLVSITYRLRGTGGARDMSTKELPWRLDASQSGGGLIMDVGCHVIDRIDYLCGPLQDVKGSAEHKRSGNENENEAILDDVGVAVENYCHASATIGAAPWAALSGCEGATVDLEWDFSITDPSDAFDELRFVGSNGRTLRMAGMSPNGPIEVLDTGMETDTDTDGDGDGTTVVESMAFDMPEHTGQGLIQAVTNDLIDRKKGKGSNEERERERPDFLSFGDNAIRAQTVIDTMLESYYGGREIGYWTRVDSWPGRTVGGDPKK